MIHDFHAPIRGETESETAVEERAPLEFAVKDFELADWKTSVDLAEAERDLAVQVRSVDTLVTEFTLDNGMHVIMAPSLGYPVVDIRLVLPGGSLHESPDMPGLADVAAHLLAPGRFRMTAKVHPVLGKLAFESVLSMGGDVESSVGTTTTTLRLAGMSMYVDGLLWRLYWQTRAGDYDAKTVSRWRSFVTRASESADEVRDRRKYRAFMAALLGPEHPYVTRPPMRELASRIKRSHLLRFHRRHHRTRGATLIIAGQFDAAFVEQEVRRLFGSIRAGEAPAPRAPPRITPGPARYLGFVDDDAIQTEILIAHATPARGQADMPARAIIEEMIRLDMSSLREHLGASYGAQVSYDNGGGPGVLLIHASVDRERAQQAYQVMRAAMDEIRSGKSVAAFVRARRHVLRKLLADRLDSEAVADELESFAKHGVASDFWEQQARRVARMRMAEIMAVIERDLDASHEVVLIQGRRNSIEATFAGAGIETVEFVE